MATQRYLLSLADHALLFDDAVVRDGLAGHAQSRFDGPGRVTGNASQRYPRLTGLGDNEMGIKWLPFSMSKRKFRLTVFLLSRESEIGYCSWGAETPKQRSWLVLAVAPGSEHESH